jgi:hypothetical protein
LNTSELRQAARSLQRREFIEQYPHLFLVFNAPADTAAPVNSFATQAVPSEHFFSHAHEIVVLPIVKGADSPFQAHISLGRARNCDLVVRHASVSKLHARFRTEEGSLLLVDAGSQNGTFVDGKRVLPNESAPIVPSTELLFGSVAARAVDAAGLYKLLLQAL